MGNLLQSTAVEKMTLETDTHKLIAFPGFIVSKASNIRLKRDGQLAVGVALSTGYQGAGLVVLSPKVYDVSGGSCTPGERSLLFQI